ncbi:hypothetical protein [Labrys miyagiensis]|uniref:hypothetical protein n=1 Tax=Labrys miyagiensis TaxID=346912 RepID=UPI0024E12048|nr:hypothetical protein [Labrys miyagiensis]
MRQGQNDGSRIGGLTVLIRGFAQCCEKHWSFNNGSAVAVDLELFRNIAGGVESRSTASS